MIAVPETSVQADTHELLDSSQQALGFSLRGFTIAVRSDRPEPLRWLRWFLDLHFHAGPAAGDWQVGYRCDPNVFERLADGLSRYPSQAIPSALPDGHPLLHREYLVPGMRVLLNDEFHALCFAWPGRRELLLVSREDDEPSRFYLARAVRKLATLHHQRQGAAVIHAAVFEEAGSATLVVAPRGGGKSTYLIHHLLAGARFITNDRALLYLHRGRVMVRGLPNVITLHPGTLELFPQLRARLDRGRFRQARAPGIADGCRRITSAQLCRAIGAPTRTSAPVARIVLPSPPPAVTRLIPPDRAAGLLREAIFDYAERPRVFFSSLYPVDLAKFRRAADFICDQLATTCPCRQESWADHSTGRVSAGPG